MNLQQLRSLVEVVRHNLNITEAADSVCLSQPGISKQLKQLEQELQLTLFVRKGRNLTELTPAGKAILAKANEVLSKVEDIYQIARECNNQHGVLSIATTHTQARYLLPTVVGQFINQFPDVNLNLQQGTPKQVAKLASQGDVDIAIATEAVEHFENLVTMPCYQWNRCVVVKKDHPLAECKQLTLAGLAAYPLITYVYGYTGRYKVDEAFVAAELQSNIILTAVDADVIKTYVRLGLGVGIIANMAFDASEDKDLVALNASDLFGASVTHIALMKDRFIREYIYRFITLFAPHLTEEVVRRAMLCSDAKERKAMFEDFIIPAY